MPRQIRTLFIGLSYNATSVDIKDIRIPFEVQDITIRGVYSQTNANSHTLISSDLFGSQQVICIAPPGTDNAQENTLVRFVQPKTINGSFTFTCLGADGELKTPTGDIVLQIEFESAKN
jgi:hypothetical protein